MFTLFNPNANDVKTGLNEGANNKGLATTPTSEHRCMQFDLGNDKHLKINIRQ